MNTSLTCSGETPERSKAALMAEAPSSGADRFLRTPWNAPIEVRAAPTMTTGSASFIGVVPSFPLSFRAPHQFAAAIRADAVHSFGARSAEGAFIAADMSLGIKRQRAAALFA